MTATGQSPGSSVKFFKNDRGIMVSRFSVGVLRDHWRYATFPPKGGPIWMASSPVCCANAPEMASGATRRLGYRHSLRFKRQTKNIFSLGSDQELSVHFFIRGLSKPWLLKHLLKQCLTCKDAVIGQHIREKMDWLLGQANMGWKPSKGQLHALSMIYHDLLVCA